MADDADEEVLETDLGLDEGGKTKCTELRSRLPYCCCWLEALDTISTISMLLVLVVV